MILRSPMVLASCSNVFARQNAAGGILRRVENDEFGARVISRASSFTSRVKARSSRRGMGTALPPMYSIMDS